MFFPKTLVITVRVQVPQGYGLYVGEHDPKYTRELQEVSEALAKKYDGRKGSDVKNKKEKNGIQ